MPTLTIHKRNGSVTSWEGLGKLINDLKDGSYLVTVENLKKRSSRQNAYLHGPMLDLVYQGLRDAGFDEVRSKEDAKMIIKTLFLKRSVVNKDTGEMIEYIQDTRNLTTVEMVVFIEDVIRWAATYLNVVIPYPGEKLMIEW